MKNIINTFKRQIPLLILIIIFLIIEVYCDLTLPSYTADIVNIGIQNTNFDIITSTGINMMMMVIVSIADTLNVSYFSSILSSSFSRYLIEEIYEKILNI